MHMLAKLTVMFALVYIILLGMMYFLQNSFTFHRQKYADLPASVGLKNFEEVELKTADNKVIYGWYKKADEGKSTIIYFHGNAERLTGASELFSGLAVDGTGVFALAYRGYGKSNVAPNELGFYADARAVVEYLKKAVPENSLVVFGRSIGTGVAVQMATEYDLGGVVLLSPYSSLSELAANIYWYFPVRRLGLVRNKFDSISKIKKVNEPLLIIHGGQDTLIPITMAKILFEAANMPKKFVEFPEADHIYFEQDKLVSEIKKFLAESKKAQDAGTIDN